ncbi:hypothetical protein GQ600_3444 [Phytophthora cactorum]|nr:hypothetical protein GQ600_3444 [Phytophthora cactorum]
MQAASPLRMSNLAGRAPKAKRSASTSTPAVDVSEPSASGSKPSIVPVNPWALALGEAPTGLSFGAAFEGEAAWHWYCRRQTGGRIAKFCDFCGNTASVFVDMETTLNITLQTRQMHRFFEAFREVVILDFTHGTNVSKDKLHVEDVFGHFPLARVLICHFHLKKYLRTEMAKSVYGGRNAADLDRVEDSVDMMIKSKDGGEYDCGLRYMYYILDGFDGQETS